MARDDIDNWANLDDLVADSVNGGSGEKKGLVFGDDEPKSKWDELDTPEMPQEEKRRGFSRIAKRSVDPDEDSSSFLKKKRKKKELSLDDIEGTDFDAIDADEDELADIPDEIDDAEYEDDLGLEDDEDYDGGVMDDLLDVDDYVGEDEDIETDEEFMARQRALKGGRAVSRTPRSIRRAADSTQAASSEGVLLARGMPNTARSGDPSSSHLTASERSTRVPLRQSKAVLRPESRTIAVKPKTVLRPALRASERQISTKMLAEDRRLARKAEQELMMRQPRTVVPLREVETRVIAAPEGQEERLPMRARQIEREVLQPEEVELPMETSEMPAAIYEPEPHEKEDEEVLQDKLVAGFLYGGAQLEKAKVNISDADVTAVLTGMRDGRFGQKSQRDLIKSVKSPVERFGEDGVDRRLGVAAEKERRILAYHTGAGFANWRETDGVTIKEFLKKYPLPQDFDAASEGFLRVIRKNSGDVTYGDYVKAMENFKWQIYGTRQDYFEALKLLIRRSEEQVTTATGLIELDEVGVKEIVSFSRVEGDAWIEGPMERKLTMPTILRNKLTPKWKLELENITLAFSQAFKMTTRDVVMAYIQVENVWKVRSFYRNALDGVWKYLPDYAMRQTGSGKAEIWCGLAYAEEMLILPAALQMRLSEIVEKGYSRNIVDSTDYLFVGTALRYESMKDYLDTRKLARLSGPMYAEVAARPTVVFGGLSRIKVRPSEVGVAEKGAQPDFSHVVHEWTTTTGLNGKAKATSFYSKDGNLEYVFFEDSRHRAWLTAVEVKTKLTSTGLRAEWAYPGDLATPVYERVTKSDGYGDDADQKGGYISMWDKYVSKLGIIKDYLRAKLDRK